MEENFYSQVNKVDAALLKTPDHIDIEQIIKLIKQEKALTDYFFKKIKDPVWFSMLKKKRYFNPETIPKDKDGNTLFWNILDYLERISEQLKEPANEKYAKELINIIESVIQYSRNTKKINNYYIWWYFVKILNNIPTDLIISNNLTTEKFKIWLEEWANPKMSGDLAISDIVELLLGKFLKDNRTIKHAEAIIKVITRIEKKGEKDSFTRRDEAKMTWSPYWTLKGFEKHNKIIGEKCSNDIIFDIADKLNMALKYKQIDYYRFIVINKDIYRLKVCRVEREGLKEKEIGFKDGYFKCILEQYEKEQIKGLEDIDNNLYQLHHIGDPKKPIDEFDFKRAVKNKEEFREELKSELKKTIGLKALTHVVDCDKKIEELYEGLYEDYSHIWFCSLADSGDVHENDAEGVLAIILRDTLVNKSEAKRDKGKQVLEEFLTSSYRFPLFRRMILYCMDKFWEDYKDLFDRFLDVVPNVLDRSDYEVEFYDILKKYNKDLDADRLKKLIENVPEYYRKEGPKHEASWKYKWLSALKDNDFFSEWYEEEKRNAELKEDKPYEPRRSAFMGGVVAHKPPITTEEIVQMGIADLIKFMKEFKGTDIWGTFEGKPDKEGLAGAFQAAVKDNPKKFTAEIGLFKEVDYSYKHSLLKGFLDAWKSNKDIAWDRIFDFYEDYIKYPTFIEESLKAQGEDSGDGIYVWIIEALSDLIEEGSRNDERAFDKEYFPQVERLYGLMLGKSKGKSESDKQRDAITYALNTTLGRLIRSYIMFSLHVSRLNKEPEKDWGKNKYDRFFGKGIEAYIWFGMFFPNMTYLDKDWAKRIIGQLKDRGVNDFQWQRFMEAYLFGSRVYDNIYKLMLCGLISKI